MTLTLRRDGFVVTAEGAPEAEPGALRAALDALTEGYATRAVVLVLDGGGRGGGDDAEWVERWFPVPGWSSHDPEELFEWIDRHRSTLLARHAVQPGDRPPMRRVPVAFDDLLAELDGLVAVGTQVLERAEEQQERGHHPRRPHETNEEQRRVRGHGGRHYSPGWPAVTCVFCAWIAERTSAGVVGSTTCVSSGSCPMSIWRAPSASNLWTVSC